MATNTSAADSTTTAIERMTEALQGLLLRVPRQNHREEQVRLQPPVFNGNGDVELFIQQFEAVADISCWQADVALLKLRESLVEQAKECSRGETVAEVYNTLRLRYGITPREARAKLRDLCRNVKTSLQEHAAEVERLVNIAHQNVPGDNRQEMMLESFLSSLGHLALHRHLLAVNPQTLEAAIRSGNEFLRSGVQGRSDAVRVVDQEDTMVQSIQNDMTLSQLPAILKRITELLDNLQTISQRKKAQDGKLRLCYQCNQPGHLKADCPQLKEGPSN